MRLSNEDYLMISQIVNTEIYHLNEKLSKFENILKKSLKKKRIDDSWMSYDELSKNIIALSGDEYYRDFNIVRMNE
ncbi:hypothetical protein KBB69_02895 [Candidatus Dojkabacteria bacterium]|jgi:predicted nucleic acid-binding protein|nr:hypothetical protein [Candidatus Dojkabacteria bacterium]HPR92036.1 hypothetical protein [Candidatus Dojkabacteria bacterium]HRZ84926.1 hypothetical protein [Candidatus Dojkabacteria bacterium]